MAHNCIDWTTRPPERKVPFLVLSHGDDRIYTIVPKDFKTLEDIARKEFNLGNADIKIFSSCMNLCSGLPARITESAWEHMSPFVGCATIDVVGSIAVEPPQEQPENAAIERDAGDPMITDKENESDHSHWQDAPTREAVRDNANHREERERGEEEASPPSPRKTRHRRRVVSEDEDEDEGDESERGPTIPATSQTSVFTSPPRPAETIKQNGYHSSQTEAEQSDRPIKQEKPDTSTNHSPPQAQSDMRSQLPPESSENPKLVIRVAHRPSQQESKFTTKGTTKVSKVLSSACKSFGLDASRASMYLIVSTVDEEGEVECLFPCEKNDTIVRAGAEFRTESRFLLKMAGEV